jgi:hypothetical protein
VMPLLCRLSSPRRRQNGAAVATPASPTSSTTSTVTVS